MKKSIFVSKLVSAIFVTILLTRSMIITPSPKIIFVPFLICSISMAMEQIGLILDKRKFAILFHKLFIIGFFLFWFPVSLVYYEEFQTKEEAMRREYAIKHMTRSEKSKLISEYRKRITEKDND